MTPFPLLALVTVFLVEACGSNSVSPLEVIGAPPRTFTIAVGQQVDIQMGSVGPGEYVSPPTLMGSAIDFLGVSLATIQVPAGETQLFHFKGVAPGQAIVRFHNTNQSADVSDTVVVR
jgi:hypothetical protein